MRSSLISTIVAGSLLVSTTAAAAAPQSGPVAARSGAEVEDSEGIVGSFAIIGLIAVLAVVAIFVLLDDDDEDVPTSP